MSRTSGRLAATAGLLAVAAAGSAAHAASADAAGRSVVEVLAELRRGGLHLLYSNDLVTPDLKVIAEPASASPLDEAREVLKPHRLDVVPGPAGRWLVVRAADDSSDVLRHATGKIAGSDTEGESAGPPGSALEAITVVAGRYSLGDAGSSQQLSRSEIARVPHLADDPLRITRQLPGITGSDFSAGLNVRGGARDEAAIMVDGVRIHDPFHLKDLQGALGLIDAGVVESMEVLTGGFGAEYGDRMSAIVSMRTLVPAEQPETTAGISFVNAYLRSQGPIQDGRGHWLTSIRRGYLDWLFQLIDSEGDFTPRYWDFFTKADWLVGDATLVAGNLLLARDDLRFVDSGPQVSRSFGKADSAYGWVTASTYWGHGLSSDTVLSVSSIDRHRDNADQQDGFFAAVHDDRRFAYLAARSDWRWQATENALALWGLEVSHASARYRYELTSCISDPFPSGPCAPAPARRADLEVGGESYGSYVSARLQLIPRVTGEFGVRADRQTYAGFSQSEISPRASLRFEVTDASTLRLGWGRYFQPQQPDELQVEDGNQSFARAEDAEHRVAAWDVKMATGMTFRTELFDKRYGNLRTRYENQFDPFEVVPEARPDRIAVRPDASRASGAEVSIASAPDRAVSWRLAYGYLEALDSFGNDRQPRSWDQTHSVTGSLNLALKSWNLNLFGAYHTGWPRTPLDVEVSSGPTGIIETPVIGERNALRYPAYVRLDMRLSRNRRLANGELGYFFEVYNVLDRHNRCCIGDVDLIENPDGTLGTRVNYDDWLPRLPSIGIHWTFR